MKIRASRDHDLAARVLSEALDGLAHAHGSRKSRIHSERVLLKRTKAMLRLLRSAGLPGTEPALDEARRAADELAPFRMHALLEKLGRKEGLRIPRLKGRSGRNPPRHALRHSAEARRLLEGLAIRLRDGVLTPAQLSLGLRQAISCGEKTYRRSRKTENAGDFHAFRKRIKDLLYQLEALAPWLHRDTRDLRRRLEKVADLTGDAHDCIELADWLGHQPGSAKKARKLRERALRLNLKAIRRARPIFRGRDRLRAQLARVT